QDFTGISFVNLVDFDAKYGHRRNPAGYGKALEAYDERLPEVLKALKEDDLLIITADHGNDPTHHGTDHTREYVPLLIHYPSITCGKQLPIRKTFADIGATIAENFRIQMPEFGMSFLQDIQSTGKGETQMKNIIEEASTYIEKKITIQPTIGFILGSGLGVLGAEIEQAVTIPYEDIPHFPTSTVTGHKGQLVIGKLEGKDVIAMQGRFHY